jgi:hypothetical protein
MLMKFDLTGGRKEGSNWKGGCQQSAISSQLDWCEVDVAMKFRCGELAES